MPDASVPEVPVCGPEQVVFRRHMDARQERERFSGTARHLAKLFLARAFCGWTKVDTTGVMARIRWFRGSLCSAEMPPGRLGAGQQSARQARFRSICDREG